MTKKDYIKLAHVLACARKVEGEVLGNGHLPSATETEVKRILNTVISRTATVLRDDNPNFSLTRFLTAIGDVKS